MRVLVVMVVVSLAGGCGRVAFDSLGATTGDATTTGDTTTTGDGAPRFNCANRPTTTSYEFTASQEGWMFLPNSGYTGSSQWTSQGKADPGAIQVDVVSGQGALLLGWLYAPMPVGDLAGRYSALWLMTTTAGVQIKHYARNVNAEWADGGSVALTPGTWTCATLDLANPWFHTTAFDSTIVDELGVVIEGAPPVTLYADAPGY